MNLPNSVSTSAAGASSAGGAPPRELVFKIFNDSGCQAYLVGCRASGEALLVDPKAGKRAVYEKALADWRLRLVVVVDTHTHADHLSGSTEWTKSGARLWMSEATACKRPHGRLHHGDLLRVGQLAFRALAVPGHTPDSVALSGHGVVFTGDSLFVGGLARADFRGSRPAQLFDSVRTALMTLPDPTVVLPGHGYQDILFSTIGHERARNAALRHADGAAYAAALAATEGRGNTPDVDAMLAANLEAEPKLPEGNAPVAACCSMGGTSVESRKVREMACRELEARRADLSSRKAWIDVRDPWELEKEGRIPGIPNWPLSELGLHLEALQRMNPEVLSCKSGARSTIAAKTLTYLGVLADPISMTGGFNQWKASGLPVA